MWYLLFTVLAREPSFSTRNCDRWVRRLFKSFIGFIVVRGWDVQFSFDFFSLSCTRAPALVALLAFCFASAYGWSLPGKLREKWRCFRSKLSSLTIVRRRSRFDKRGRDKSSDVRTRSPEPEPFPGPLRSLQCGLRLELGEIYSPRCRSKTASNFGSLIT